MLKAFPAPLLGFVTFALLLANTLFWVPILLVFAAIKLVLPMRGVRQALDPVLVWIAETWIASNSAWMTHLHRTQWDVQGIEGLRPDDWYLVNSNHQCAADIFVLQHLLNRRIPLLKFFIKQQLIWMPVIGLAWWALDFPFMRRHSEAYLKKHPEMRAKDQESTRRACAKFALIPTSVTNFMEGTRFTPAKHARQLSPYRYLLKPKAGGVALALNAMGDKFHSILAVTIVYPDGIPGFWTFLCGGMRRVIVRVRSLPIPSALLQGDYGNDPAFREAFSAWVQQVWRDKDAQIAELLAAAKPTRSH
ncbi:acyltransferase [Rhodoferax lacus]|uniref:Acyltransferase n=1 Tax=Rhodoferax lacus TaxID=2184758 RepID=A0A3E1RHV6_9BURK|nr:acyltransferase [Rhodoferax lacus]RFO98986.1 acyltransferase [Rhodoferax lacus]